MSAVGSILTNTGALQALNSLSNTTATNNSLESQLSSGLSINSPADNPAGYITAQGFTSQINGLTQAISNANQGVSLLQTADGALTQQIGIVQQLNSIAVQAANGTQTSAKSQSLQTLASQLTGQVSTISSQTQFNNINLLDGSFSGVQLQVGANEGQTMTLSIANTAATNIGMYFCRHHLYQAGLRLRHGHNRRQLRHHQRPEDHRPHRPILGRLHSHRDRICCRRCEGRECQRRDDGRERRGHQHDQLYRYRRHDEQPDDLQAAGQRQRGYHWQCGFRQRHQPLGSGVADQPAEQLHRHRRLRQQRLPEPDPAERRITSSSQPWERRPAAVWSRRRAAPPPHPATSSRARCSSSPAAPSPRPAPKTDLKTTSSAATLDSLSSINVSTTQGANSAINVIKYALASLNNQGGELGAVQQALTANINNMNTTSQNATTALGVVQDANIPAVSTQLTESEIQAQSGVAALKSSTQLQQSYLSLLP